MTPRFYFLTFLLAFGWAGLITPEAQAQDWHWGTAVSAAPVGAGRRAATTTATAITASGEVFAAYSHTGVLTLGTQTFPTPYPTGRDVVVARYNAAGTFVAAWLTGHADVGALQVDVAGNLYAAGRMTGPVTAGGVTHTPLSTADIFIAKWNAAGTLQWLRQGENPVVAYSAENLFLAVDAAGNATLASNYRVSATFGSQTVVATGGQEALLLAHFDSAGTLSWLRTSTQLPGQDALALSGLAAAPGGTLFVVGMNGGFEWAGTLIPENNTQRGCWLKLNSAGLLVAQKPFGNYRMFGARVAAYDDTHSVVAFNLQLPTFSWGTTLFNMPTGSTAGAVITRLDATGTPQWVQTATVGDSAGVGAAALSVAPGGSGSCISSVYLGGSFQTIGPAAALTSGSLVLQTPRERSTDGFVLILNGDTGGPTSLLPVVSSNSSDNVAVIAANAAGQLSVGGVVGGDTASFGSIKVPIATPGSASAYVAKLVQRYNLTRGTVFGDTNANALLDVGETGRSGVVVEVQPGATHFSTTSDGQYHAVADLSTYSLSIPNPPRYHTAVPLSAGAAITFSTYGNLSGGHDFALQPTPNQQDLAVTLTPVTLARPGFAVTYRLTARNVGTVALAQPVLTLAHDPLLAFVSSSLPATASGTTHTINLPPLQPGETHNVDVLFQLAVTAPLGHNLTATATLGPLAGDLTSADNTEVNTLTVTGAYDPNDISVNYPTLTLPQVQTASRSLDYTVRFQNMGTDTAFTIVVRDTLPTALLNLGTVQVLAASHTCTWRLGAGGVVTVSFPNVQLPPRTTNTLRSAGFVRFRVVPYTTLAAGDLIPNHARIHFDFNAPVATNTALTTVLSPTGTGAAASQLAGAAWPNPATGTLHVAVELPAAGAVRLTLTDALGRVVRTRSATAPAGIVRETLTLDGLAPGVYLVRTETAGTRWSQRVVVQ